MVGGRLAVLRILFEEVMSQLSCVASGNKLQRQKKGPWSLGEKERQGSTWGKVARA